VAPEARRLRVGVDFDNTLVRYDEVFARAARERGLVEAGAPATKLHVRDTLRGRGREDDWVELQGHVYGARMDEAEAFPGALDLLAGLREAGHEVFIISHRTLRPARGPAHDLHRAAREWVGRHLRRGGEALVEPARVHFETTREDKVRRIAAAGCDVFVDDLPEVLLAPDFPARTRRILFDPDDSHPGAALERVRSWRELGSLLEVRA
jgi:hypothetical protein